jgi:recombination protein U
LNHIIENGGIGFLIVRFTSLDRNYILMGKDLMAFLKDSDRKSIPLEYFEKNGYLIDISYMPRIDYLKVIDKIIGGNNGNN